MTMAVQLHPVPGGNDLGNQRRPPRHLLTDQKEGGRGPALAQGLEHRGRALRVRAIVEGEGDAFVPTLHLNPQGGTEPRHDRRQRRSGVQDDGSGGASAKQRLDQWGCWAALELGWAAGEGSASETAGAGASLSLPMWIRPSSGLAITL